MRDEFPFEIVRMPDLNANIPDHVFYGSFMAELLRIGRATLFYQDFLPKAREIFNRMVKQGGSAHKLRCQIEKLTRHPEVFTRYNKSSKEIQKAISQ